MCHMGVQPFGGSQNSSWVLGDHIRFSLNDMQVSFKVVCSVGFFLVLGFFWGGGIDCLCLCK